MSYSALNIENNPQTNSNPTNKNQHVRFQVEKADVSMPITAQSKNENGINFKNIFQNDLNFIQHFYKNNIYTK